MELIVSLVKTVNTPRKKPFFKPSRDAFSKSFRFFIMIVQQNFNYKYITNMFAEEKKQNIFRNMLTLIDIGKIYLG